MTDRLVIYERRGNIGLLTLNRPESLNALDDALIDALAIELRACEANNDIKIIMIIGQGKSFIAGADIKQMAQLNFPQNYMDDFIGHDWHAISHCRKPVIAAVNGYALGGGCELAMMCDIIFASEKAQFAQPEITLGILPGIGGTQRMARSIGKAKTMDMVLSAKRMSAHEAEECGLISRILPHDDFIDHALAAAQEIATHSLPALMMAKQAVNYAYESHLKAGLDMERQLFLSGFALEDRIEGMNAFVEKRKANIKNK